MTDHSKFIETHHKKSINPRHVQKERSGKKALFHISLVVLFAVLYLGICIYVAYILGLNTATLVIIAILFTGAFGLALMTRKLLYTFSLRERERNLLHEVIEGSRGARLITNPEDKTVYTNTKFNDLCKDHGQPCLETLTAMFSNNPEALSHFTFLADKAHRGLTDSIELSTKLDDHEHWFSVTAQPVSDWEGFIHWRIDDITDKIHAERSMHEEREKLIDFTDNAPVGFFSVNENGRFVFVNATLARWLGEDITTLLNRGHLHQYIVSPPEKAKPYQIDNNNDMKQITKLRMKGPAGKSFMVSVNQIIVKLPDGSIRTRGIAYDLTSEEEMVKALKASEDRFQRFFEEAPLGIIMVGPTGRIDDCNAAIAALLGTKISKLEGRLLKDIIENDQDYDTLMSAMERIDKNKNLTSPLEITLNDNGNSVICSVYARKFKNASGDNEENIVLHFIDLTEKKSLEAQFVQSQKMQAIGQLAGGIAHDFNNLLTAITGFCDLLLLRHKPGDPSFGDINQIKQNTNRASNLVRQLLAFSRQQTLQPKVQDISDILTEISNLLRRLLGPNVELELSHAASLEKVRVDEGQIEQVLINLAVNARDAMDNTGILKIETFIYENTSIEKHIDDYMPPGQWVAISVTDTGCGMDTETKKRIFEPFFTTKEIGQGTGLGLATVYGIVRQTDGYLDVKTAPGQGTTFTIYLPAVSGSELNDAETAEPEQQEKTRDLTGTATILLVEDEDAVRTFASRALKNKGYKVLDAESAEDALDIIQKETIETIDLLISDVIMPNMDGPTLAKKVREMNKDLKIIFISGYTEEKLRDQFGKNITFLPKPFSLQKLAETVKDVLEE